LIRDSEAIQYLGKEVEVRGWVVSVTTSPLGTTFSNAQHDFIKAKIGVLNELVESFDQCLLAGLPSFLWSA